MSLYHWESELIFPWDPLCIFCLFILSIEWMLIWRFKFVQFKIIIMKGIFSSNINFQPRNCCNRNCNYLLFVNIIWNEIVNNGNFCCHNTFTEFCKWVDLVSHWTSYNSDPYILKFSNRCECNEKCRRVIITIFY